YPLLEIMPGNDFYVYNSRAFNMMTRYEFLSDQYIGLNIEHNLGGSLFNYVPLLKKAKMRLFWNAKAVYGSLSEKNQILNNYSQQYQFKDLKGNPYVELGTGIENIFQFLRIDFVWRVLPES